ncbi:uncharacterized protein A4U43_C01F990 [Asparagus officinalis]|uniref:B box-type domain-containing protein n=1 Tax=Asparagus officinalis TaxID=4686 RepID=A0A5P1FL22_ASPOF|nr:uncharacterized protein LOC109829594 [Asparagus officinalis]ONK78918.1 uncharacterized protein A4U43_C01F990 [Asparagus officinalis]
MKPAWLEALGSQEFFIGCSFHGNAKKNEKNICCLDCCVSICPHCVASHRHHRQVRRYVYRDVVRLEDLDKLIDCSNVQPYTINSSKVVFLKKRPQSRQFKGNNTCTSCDRSLQEPYIYCSLGCKVDYLLRHDEDISPYLRTCESLQLGPDFFIPNDVYCSGDDDAVETTHSTVVEGDEPSGSSDSENFSMPRTVFTREKGSGLYFCARSASGASDEKVVANMSRRKGVPHRSPLC